MTPSSFPPVLARCKSALPHASPKTTLRAAGFYAAIALPLLYLPVLVSGLDTAELATLGALLAVNATALLLGHGYDADH
ncbi:hypothetical protein [Halobaculum sp. D14]|uniref:hypothetical protein n=1 Tax=Halobaculum sp. D14 TaxID=3421642 RepID=UPI003EBD4E46